MDPQDLLQVSMVEEDKPIELNATGEMDATGINDENAINEFNYPSLSISNEELNFYQTLLGDITNIRFKKLHCTACNIHMGTAPIAERHRFEHPLLKVLVCEQCYNFYTSGDFEKDADGSELYCRWCGQGGQVYCCAKCPFVFCKKCIQRNIGRSMVIHISSSDDWLCYACNPKDIWMLRGLNWAIKQYSNSKNSIRLSDRTPEDNKDIISDYSLCCRGQPNTGKQKVVQSTQNKKKEDSTTTPIAKKKEDNTTPVAKKKEDNTTPVVKKKEEIITAPRNTSNNAVKTSKAPLVPKVVLENISNKKKSDEAEVVCTPDIISVDDDDDDDVQMTTKTEKPKAPQNNTTTNNKVFLSVKSVSKLIDPNLNKKPASLPLQPPKITKTVHSYPLKTISLPATQLPLSFESLASNPVVTEMIQNLQKHVKPGDPQKIIKIVSPDGRAFLIDPNQVNAGQPQQLSQTSKVLVQQPKCIPPPLKIITAPKPAPKPIINAHTPPAWVDQSLTNLTKVSQLLSNIILNLTNEKNFITQSLAPNWTLLYHSCEMNLKILSENIGVLQTQLQHDYLSENPGEITADADVRPDTDEHFAIDPKDMLEQTLEEGDTELPQHDDDEVDEDNKESIKKLQEDVVKMHKQIAKRKKMKKKEKLNKQKDEIFDMDVTCESDDDDDVFSVKSSDSDSDCVVVGGNDKEATNNRKRALSDSNPSIDDNVKSAKIARIQKEQVPATETPSTETGDKTDNVEQNNKVQSTQKEVDPIESSLNLYKDLLSIASAIRESIKESQPNIKPNKKIHHDLEKLLSSSVVYRKNESASAQTSGVSRNVGTGNSFGDAFSNFIATKANDIESDDDIDDNQSLDNGVKDDTNSKLENGVDNNSHTGDSMKQVLLTEHSTANLDNTFNCGDNSDTFVKDNVDLENEMAVLQKLAENCIAESVTATT